MNGSGNHDILTDVGALRESLARAGLSPGACQQKASLFAAVTAVLPAANTAGRRAFFVPGRIEVLGKHTDYAGGRSLLAAAERGFCLIAAPRDDGLVAVIDAATSERVEFVLNTKLVPRVGHWSNYPMTVARRIARNFPGARCGADIALASDLPPAAGMSSSSALIVAVFLALAEVNHLSARREYADHVRNDVDLAAYLGTVENGQSFGSLEGDSGVGTFGGSEDHTAILCAEPNCLSQYAYCPVRFERSISLPSGYTFAVGTSGVVAEKTGAARQRYNRASQLAATAARLWRRATGREDPHLAAALGSSPDAAERLQEVIANSTGKEFDPGALSARVEHFIAENEQIVPAAGDALVAGDLEAFGRLVDASQEAADRMLGNQVPQTVALAASARRQGAVAASAFGAGFGGSVWALVDTGRADAFSKQWAEAYRHEFPENAQSAEFFITPAGPAARQVC